MLKACTKEKKDNEGGHYNNNEKGANHRRTHSRENGTEDKKERETTRLQQQCPSNTFQPGLLYLEEASLQESDAKRSTKNNREK